MKEERFWKNYFYHCEQVRVERLGLRDERHHPSHIKPAEVIATVDSSADIGGKKVSAIDNKLEQDDESLVPASEADDSSYVLPSAPTTGNTLTTTQSVDDLVLVNSQV